MHEFEFIDWIKTYLGNKGNHDQIPVGIGDDMAVIDFRGGHLLLGSDMTIQGVHFEESQATAEQVGHKALGRCLSDCAAMGGEPLAAIISVAKPVSLSEEWLKGLYYGMGELADRYRCPIVGGDTSGSPERLVIDVALLGRCESNPPILRSGARVGDTLYVTGPLGGSILGKHLSFEPRIPQATLMVRNLPVHAMVDISDGLSSDLNHLCKESGCGAELWVDRLEAVISHDARRLAEKTGNLPLVHALDDGEDFELLAAIGLPPDQLPSLGENIVLYPIGMITSERTVSLVYPDGTRSALTPHGFRHF